MIGYRLRESGNKLLEMLISGDAIDVLCIGAHPDDIEIGCGGTLLAIGHMKDIHISLAVLTGDGQRQHEAVEAARKFGGSDDVRFGGLHDGRLPGSWDEVKGFLEDLGREVQPSLIFAPRADDSHQDHRLIAELVPTVWRDTLILGYEIPKWDGDLGRVTHYMPLSQEIAARKFELLDESYPSQRYRDWWDSEVFLGLMRLRGVECHKMYAEGFVVSKSIIGLDRRIRGGGLR